MKPKVSVFHCTFGSLRNDDTTMKINVNTSKMNNPELPDPYTKCPIKYAPNIVAQVLYEPNGRNVTRAPMSCLISLLIPCVLSNERSVIGGLSICLESCPKIPFRCHMPSISLGNWKFGKLKFFFLLTKNKIEFPNRFVNFRCNRIKKSN